MATKYRRFASRGLWAALLLALWVATPLPAAAQYGPGPSGRAPYSYQPPGRNEAGRFDYYALVLSWSPTYCGTQRRGNNDDPQCRRDARPYAFVLHGLWPQHERGWPENCPTRERPFVPRSTINRMLDIMPSPKLVIHEYRKHGTCSGLSPNAYFDFARGLFARIKVPPRFVRPNRGFLVAPSELKQELIAANPGLTPEMIAISCRGAGDRLREVHICFSREGTFHACGRNEDQRRMCSQARMYVPPVRDAAGSSQDGQEPDRRDSSPLPGPKMPGDGRRI